MFNYDKETGRIELTRGDTAYLDVMATNAEGNALQPADVRDIRMTVRQEVEGPVTFQIAAENGAIKIRPEVTQDLEFGTYRYDVQMTLTNGDVSTYGPCKFKLLQEVTY